MFRSARESGGRGDRGATFFARFGAFVASAAIALTGSLAAAEPFAISSVSPRDGEHDVAVRIAVQAHVSARFDPATATSDSVRLWRGKERTPARVTCDLGGVVTLSPDEPLAPETEYRFEATGAIRSLDGRTLAPFSSSFRTGRAAAPAERKLPPFRKTKIGVAAGVTSLALGPDDALYGATWEGRLLRWTLDAETGRATGEPRVIWSPAKTRITALCFDPDATANRRLWIALDDNAGAATCELRFTAKIVRLTLPAEESDAPVVEEFVRGLPVGDHAVSGLSFGPDGRLYFFCGAITMLGGDKPKSRETPLSAAVLTADVRSAGFRPIDVATDPPVSYDPHAPDAPVKIFATGIREAYDLCWRRNGKLYAGVNQNDTAEWSPANEKRKLPAVSVHADEPLIAIAEGKYYGHPNPSRDEWVLLGGNPTSEVDPWEVAKLPVGTQPEPNFDPALFVHNLVPLGGQSADGCAEWRGPGPLAGRLLVCFYTSARTIHTFAFSPSGDRVIAEEPLADSAGEPLRFGGPLDLVADEARGRIYVVDFADPRRGDSAKEGALWLVAPVEPGR